MKRITLWVGMLALLWAVSAAQAVMTVTLVDRHILANSDNGSDSDANASTGVFSSSVVDEMLAQPTSAIATQNTDVDPLGLNLSGDGFALLLPQGTTQLAVSFCEVKFDLDAPHVYSLSGLLDVGGIDIDDGTAFSSLFLGRTDVVSTIVNFGDSDPMPINEGGVLPTGSYILTVQAHAESPDDGDGGAAYAFNLQLHPQPTTDGAIPEPMTAGLSLLGLTASSIMALRRHR